MKRISGLLLLLLLSACATGGRYKKRCNEKSGKNMDAAVAPTEAAKPEAVDQALLPPLAVSPAQSDNKTLETKFDLAVNNTPANMCSWPSSPVPVTAYWCTRMSAVSISLTLKDVTVFDALEAIREMYGL